MQIEQAKPQDLAEYSQMDLGMDYDYVKDIFTDVAEQGVLYRATLEGSMVGVTMLRRIDQDHAYLGLARVDRRHRNRGVTTKLSKKLMTLAGEQGCSWIGLCTNSENMPARRVAEKVGLERVGHHLSCNYHSSGGKRVRLPGGVTRQLDLEKKRQLLSAAYAQTGVLPRRPYAMIRWPGTAM